MRAFMLLTTILASLAVGLAPAPGGAQTDSQPDAGAAGQAAQVGIPIDESIFGALRARNIGPAVMSGRVAALDAVNAEPRIVYAGAASGGVWKSTNGGVNFRPVFDDHCQSIGAIAIDQAHPDTVWVGTGEPWVRNSVSVGDGVYRTVNGGDDWERMGLEETERIGKIVVDPNDSKTVWVAALGHLWNSSETRGLFKTADDGATWEKVLYVDENTGCTDVVLVPGLPNVVFACMWDFRRGPDTFRSGGPGSGLYRSLDGGNSWERLGEGLPEGELGRIAVDVSPARPSRVYALVESADSGFYRSDDMGATWTRASEQRNVKGRPFYFALVVADPQDPDRVYKPSTYLLVSRDAGEIFSGVGGWVHVDYHALWINPNDPTHMVCGNDGGVYVTHNRGGDWMHCGRLPVSQFYRVSVDSLQPYNVYGGLQDNGSWTGPSRSAGGIENADWENLGGGDGFCVLADPLDPEIVYWEWQGGNVSRLDRRTGDSKSIAPQPAADGEKLRFNWDTPIVISPTDPTRLYVGSQFLHRSTDRGESWVRLSGDLTTNNPELQRQEESGGLTVDNTTAENHCTIVTLAESPVDPAVIWVGTDDGNLQVTTDDGASWIDVTRMVPDLPRGTWVSCVEPGRHDRATAFVTCDGHRRGDMATHVFRTRDLGRTWERLTSDSLEGFARVIRQDPVNPDLLFLGTERGLFITVDGGLNWAGYREDFPPVPVHDLAIHPRENDLIIGTHGRGIWILDDYQPLRQLTAEALAQDVHLLPSPPAFRASLGGKQHSPGDGYFVARNPSQSARIIYYLKKRHLFGEMRLEVFSPDGELLKTMAGGKRKGINVVNWRMRRKPPKVTSAGVLDPYTTFAGGVGPAAPEGTYTFKLTKGKEIYEGTIEVVADPASPYRAEDRLLQQKTTMRLYDLLEGISYVAEAAHRAAEAADERREATDSGGLRKRLAHFAEELRELHGSVVADDDDVQGISGRRELREKLIRLYAAVAMYGGPPADHQIERIPWFEAQIDAARTRFDAIVAERLDDINARLADEELAPIEILTMEKFKEEG